MQSKEIQNRPTTDQLWKTLMYLSFGALGAGVSSKLASEDTEQIFLIILSLVAFFLIFIRFIWGDSRYAREQKELGLDRIKHSKSWWIRNKTTNQRILLLIQSIGFFALAFTVSMTDLFCKVYVFITMINILFLVCESSTNQRIIECLIKKVGDRNYSEVEKRNKLRKVISIMKMQRTINFWKDNNTISLLTMGFTWVFLPTSQEMAITYTLFVAIAHSVIDFIGTWSYYHDDAEILDRAEDLSP